MEEKKGSFGMSFWFRCIGWLMGDEEDPLPPLELGD